MPRKPNSSGERLKEREVSRNAVNMVEEGLSAGDSSCCIQTLHLIGLSGRCDTIVGRYSFEINGKKNKGGGTLSMWFMNHRKSTEERRKVESI